MTKWTNDEELMKALAEAVNDQDAVSDSARTAALAAFTWRTVDEELMELLHDSALMAGSAVRSTATARDLVYEIDGVSIDIEYDGSVIAGQVQADEAASVTLQRPGLDDLTVAADPAGFFRIPDVAPATVRFVVEAGDKRAVTPWVTL